MKRIPLPFFLTLFSVFVLWTFSNSDVSFNKENQNQEIITDTLVAVLAQEQEISYPTSNRDLSEKEKTSIKSILLIDFEKVFVVENEATEIFPKAPT